MKTKQNTVTFVIITLLSLAAVIHTYTLVKIDAWLLPRIVSYILLILSLAGTISSVLAGRKKSGDQDSKSMQIFKAEELRPLLEMTAWIAGLVLAIYLFGFYPSIFVFAFAYMKRCKRSLLTAVVYSVVLTAALYVAFRYGFSARLHEGLLFMRRF